MPVSRKNPKRGKKSPTSQRSREKQRAARSVKKAAEQPSVEELFAQQFGE